MHDPVMNTSLRTAPRIQFFLFAILLFAMSTGCTDKTPSAQLVIQPINNPAPLASSLPHVSANSDEVVISWVHKTSQGHALSFARSSNQTLLLDRAQQIAEGDDWFVNWADFPAVFLSSTGQLAAHWLQRTTPTGYGYDISYVTSADGTSWSAPTLLHNDGTHTEHGFVSWFEHNEQVGAIWLDGRHTQPSEEPDAHHADGPMTLRGRLLGSPSIEVDNKVCDCCQTSAVSTAHGNLFFYRDRSDDEIRDIYVAHSRSLTGNNHPSVATPLHHDAWQIDGCPVNGPQADAIANTVVTAWFTMADGVARVKVARSIDGGATFTAPVVVSSNNALGRVDTVMLNTHQTLVSFLEKDADNNTAVWRIALLDEHLNVIAIDNLATVVNARGSGFVRMSRINPPNGNKRNQRSAFGGKALAAWAEGADENSRIRTALLSVE